MFKNLLRHIRGDSGKHFSYEEAREILEQQNDQEKSRLADHRETNPEILYYLATDAAPEIRRKVATNANTPHQANSILAGDEDCEVRQELARKIARMLPDLAEDEVTRVREKAIEILETLARDQLPEVRRILSEELKAFDCVPKHIILRLAGDDHLEVCAPILEYSPLLGADDLKEIIAATTVDGALQAIARRKTVDEDVSEAITSSLDIPAVATLLTNENAQIRESTLDSIIDQAEDIQALHHPLVSRASLSLRAIKRIAGFVAASLVDQLIDAYDLDPDLADDLLSRARARISEQGPDQEKKDSLARKAADFFEKGLLDDVFLENLVKNRQRELLFHCLSHMAQMPVRSIRKIIGCKKARRVVALAWRSNISMRTAIKIQQEIACIPAGQILNARDGTDYPLSRAEMEYDLALYDGGA